MREKEVWLSDLNLMARNLASLQRARSASGTSPGLDGLIEEGAAFVAELRRRAEAAGNLALSESGEPASNAEGRSLEDFLESLEDTDERFLAGEVDTVRPVDEALIAVLNTVLCNHFLAIEQFFLQGFMLEQCGETALGEVRIGHSVDEMTFAFRVPRSASSFWGPNRGRSSGRMSGCLIASRWAPGRWRPSATISISRRL